MKPAKDIGRLLEIMAAGCPIVLGVAGEAKTLLERAGAGIAIEPENVGQLIAAIHDMKANASLRKACAENGRRFIKAEYQRKVLALKYLSLLKSLEVQSTAAEPFSETETASEVR